MEHSLAQCVVSFSDLSDLGILGFRVGQNVIDTALTDSNGNITEAADLVIRTWSKKYEDKEKAYSDLCEILRRIGRPEWITALMED